MRRASLKNFFNKPEWSKRAHGKPNGSFVNSALGFPLKTPQGERQKGSYSTKGSSIPLVIKETLERQLEKSWDKKVVDDVDERRYLIDSLCSSRMGGNSSTSTSFCGDLVVRASEDVEKGCMANKDEGICLNPLRIVLADGCETHIREETRLEFAQEKGRKEIYREGFLVSSKDGEEESDSWLMGSFARFFACSGLPTEGFEEEILHLMRKMNEKKLQEGGLIRKNHNQKVRCLIVNKGG